MEEFLLRLQESNFGVWVSSAPTLFAYPTILMLHTVGLAMILGGPALFLAGESLFIWRMTGTTNVTRLAAAGLLVSLVPLGGEVSALVLSLIVASLLPALAVWELRRR